MRKVKNLYPLERGFALPLGIAVGLIMLMIAITMIIRSNQTQVISLSQRQTNSSLSAAETGVAKYQALLNKYREYATYSYCPGESCGVTWDMFETQTKSKKGCSAYQMPDLIRTPDPGSTPEPPHNRFQDIIINSSAPSPSPSPSPPPGRYKLVSYKYKGTGANLNQAPGVGTMVVEGEALYPDGSGTGSITRLTVRIPVVADTQVYPGLSANVANPSSSPNYVTPTGLPASRPFLNSTSCPYPVVPSLGSSGDSTIAVTSLVNNNRDFPGSDARPGQTVYSYRLEPGTDPNKIVLGPGKKITIQTGYTVKWILSHPIDIQKGEIELQDGAKLIIYTNQSITVCGPTGVSVLPPIQNLNPNYFQIYQSGSDPNPTTPGDSTGEVTIITEGINPVRLFVYAPESTVTFQGGPNKAGGFFATVWANNFNLLADPATPKSIPVFEQADVRYDPDNPDLSIAIGPLFQQLQPISSWERTQSTASAPSPSP
jgi:hypothetical protein